MTSESLITFKTAVANVSGLPLTSVNVSGADNVYGRRRLRALSGSNIIGVDVNYTLTTVVEDMGTNDPQTALNTIQNILNTATSSGSFVAALQVAAVATGNSFLASVYNNVTIAAPVVEIGTISAVSNSRSPTPAPSLAPVVPVPTQSPDGGGKELQGNNVLIGVGIAAGIAIIGLVSLVGIRMRKDKDSKKNYLVAVEG